MSHLLGSSVAATFVSPRLRFGVVRSRSRFSKILYFSRFRSGNKNDSEGCLPAKGCVVVQHLLYQACRPHPLSVSQAPNLLQKAQNYGLYGCLSKRVLYLCSAFIIKHLSSPNAYFQFATYLQHIFIFI